MHSDRWIHSRSQSSKGRNNTRMQLLDDTDIFKQSCNCVTLPVVLTFREWHKRKCCQRDIQYQIECRRAAGIESEEKQLTYESIPAQVDWSCSVAHIHLRKDSPRFQ